MALTRIQPPAIADVREPNFRNIIINGDMAVAQRSTSTASLTSSGYYVVDRFQNQIGTMGTWTISQDTDVPTGQGFATSIKYDCTTADASPGAADFLINTYVAEGQSLQYLKKGTSSAVPLTLSFWVKSTKTGTYCVSMKDNDNNRAIAGSYTISDASTWEKKTITYPGDTTGAFDNDNAASLYLYFFLGAGSNYTSGSLGTSWATTVWANMAAGQVNLADSTSNNCWITGVQLEAGSVATDFEVISYDQNLERCYRYYEAIAENDTAVGFGGSYDSNTCGFHRSCSPKRATPSITQVSGTNYYRIYTGATVSFNSFSIAYANPQGGIFYATPTIADNLIGWFTCYNAAAKIALESEL